MANRRWIGPRFTACGCGAISDGVDLSDASEKTDFAALHVGASSNQVGAIDVLVKAGADVDACMRETPLHVATRLGLSEAVVALFRHGADVDKLNSNGYRAQLAAKDGNIGAVKALLAAGAKPDLRG